MLQDNFNELQPWTNNMDGRSKDDILLELAYSLATARKGTRKYRVKEDLIKVWRSTRLGLETKISEKYIKKYSDRCLGCTDMQKIVAYLENGMEDKALLHGLCFSFIQAISLFILDEGKAEAETLDTVDTIPESNSLSGYAGLDTHINWSKVRTEWGSAVAFMRTFVKKEEFLKDADEALVSKKGKPLSDELRLLTDSIFCEEEEMVWFVDRTDSKDDKRLISQYNNQSEFFKLCMECAEIKLKALTEGFLLAVAAPEFGSYKGYALSSLYDDSGAMNGGLEQLREDERAASPLTAREEDDEEVRVAPPGVAYVSFMITRGVLKYVYGYTRLGIDILSVCKKADISGQELKLIVKEAFLLHEIWTYEDCPFVSSRDKEAVCDIIARLWMERSYNKVLSKQMLPAKKEPGQKENSSELKKKANALEKENASLKKSLEQEKKRSASADSRQSQAEKALRSEISALKAKLEEKEEALREKEAEQSDLMELFMLSGDETVVADTGEEGLSEEDFRAYINAHKVLVWGLRDETSRKFQKMFPELSFVASDMRLTRQQLGAYEVLLMATNYTSHGNFWAARDTAKAAGIPMVYLEKTANSPECLYRALDIAVGEGAGKLHNK